MISNQPKEKGLTLVINCLRDNLFVPLDYVVILFLA